jgi:hypothetical protein
MVGVEELLILKLGSPIETFEGPSFWGHERLYLPDEERMKFRNKRLETASEGKQAPLFIDCPWLYSNTTEQKINITIF